MAKRELRIEDVRALLARRCKAAGGISAFAREFGSTRQYISAILKGHDLPHQRLCDALGIEPDGMRWKRKD
jgi:hypothetical protein